MFYMFSKVPRGSINHSLGDSITYFLQSWVSGLKDTAKIKQFEALFAEYIDRKYCVSFPFARTAIYYALRLQNLPKGSEVIMPPISIKGILDVVVSLGLVPKYVDLDLKNFCFDEKILSEAINENTRAIIITYLFGTAPNAKELIKICKEKNIYVIEDFSQGLNAVVGEKKLGSFGDCSIYSSSAIKQIDTFGGGHLLTDDERLIEEIQSEQKKLFPSNRRFLIKKTFTNLVYNIATTKLVFNLFVNPILMVLKKVGINTEKMTGTRNKLPINNLPREWFNAYTSFQANVGIKELKKVEALDKRRINHAQKILNLTSSIEFSQRENKENHSFWQLIAFAENPLNFMRTLSDHKVDSCTSSLELLSELSYYPGSCEMPNAKKIHTKGIFIPCFARMDESQKNTVYKAIKTMKISEK
jgi:perosamine synthetase